MKKWLSLVFCALAAFGCFTLAGCEDVTTPDESVVTQIEITQSPTVYIKGTELGEVKIKVTKADGSVLTDFIILQDALKGFDKEKSGAQNVSVTYQEKTADFTLMVYDKEISTAEQLKNAVSMQKDGEYWYILNGTYPVQLIINKDITLIGQSQDGVIISGPENFGEDAVIIPKLNGEEFNYAGIVTVNNTQASIQRLTVKGNPEKMDNLKIITESRYVGIAAVNAKLTVENVTVTDIRFKNEWLGGQNGYGIFATANTAASTLTIKDSTVKAFQKNGIYVLSPIQKLTIQNCKVTGAGSQDLNAQNGIVFSCLSDISDCTISDLVYSPKKTSVALFNLNAPSGCVLNNNTFKNVDFNTVEDAE